MKLMKLRVGSRAEKILRILAAKGPQSRGELAKTLNIEPILYEYDIEELRDAYKWGYRKSPPRRNTRVYPYLPGTLGYMSKMDQQRDWTESQSAFDRFHKPWIKSISRKWEITEFGVTALKVLDENSG